MQVKTVRNRVWLSWMWGHFCGVWGRGCVVDDVEWALGETIDAWLEGTGEAGKQLKLREIRSICKPQVKGGEEWLDQFQGRHLARSGGDHQHGLHRLQGTGTAVEGGGTVEAALLPIFMDMAGVLQWAKQWPLLGVFLKTFSWCRCWARKSQVRVKLSRIRWEFVNKLLEKEKEYENEVGADRLGRRGFDDAAAVLEKSMRPCEGLFRNLIFATCASAEPWWSPSHLW
jgi:hypothetical protein